MESFTGRIYLSPPYRALLWVLVSGKKIATWVAAAVALAAVGGVAGTSYYVHDQLSAYTVKPGFELPEAQPVLVQATPAPIDAEIRAATLQELAQDPALGVFHARISDASTGATVFEVAPDQPLTPASSTKVLTAAAALYALGPTSTVTTEVVQGENPGEVVIKATGDVWMTPETIAELAEQVGQAETVLIDVTAWGGYESMLPGWSVESIDDGYIAPLEPAMINGARIGAAEGDVPRSHTPAYDVAHALAAEVGAGTVDYGIAPEGAEVLASTESPDLIQRLRAMMKDSDNVMAEAIGREIAAERGTPAPQATVEVLAERGFDLTGVELADNSGLSVVNQIPPSLLNDILLRATSTDELRLLLTTLPVAGGEGTLQTRYDDLQGKGWVRAKTGTLTGVNALVGTVTSDKGNVYTFALLSNGVEIEPARRAMDTLTSALRDY